MTTSPLAWIILSICCITSAVLYRLGGIGDPFSGKFRDIGCSVITVIALLSFSEDYSFQFILANIVHAGLLFASLTTYNKWTNDLFGRRKDRMYWHNWLVTGLFYGLSALPLLFIIPWYWIVLRALVLSGLMTAWCESVKNTTIEEAGRGFLITATLPILVIS